MAEQKWCTKLQLNQIRLQARYFLGALVVFTIVYPYFGFGGLLRFSFLQPDLMIESHFTDGYVNETMRWQHFAVWLPANFAGIYACLSGIYVSYLAHSGRFFTLGFATGLSHVGYAVLLTGISEVLAKSLIPHILSALNTAGQLPISFHFSSQALGLALCGAGFAALGKMMAEATRLSDENKGFV